MLRIYVKSPPAPVEIVPDVPALELTFDDIANVPVADASSISDWNTFFDLPTNGSPFTSVEVVGDMVRLIGGSGITVKEYLFFENTNIVRFDDLALCISQTEFNSFSSCDNLLYVSMNNATIIGEGTFTVCTAMTYVSLNNATTIGDGCFSVCSALQNVLMPSCTALGTTTGDNSVFLIMSGATLTLTIPSTLMTCNGGNPDGDIQYLQANNTVTIVTV